jgi:hypothetical protein
MRPITRIPDEPRPSPLDADNQMNMLREKIRLNAAAMDQLRIQKARIPAQIISTEKLINANQKDLDTIDRDLLFKRNNSIAKQQLIDTERERRERELNAALINTLEGLEDEEEYSQVFSANPIPQLEQEISQYQKDIIDLGKKKKLLLRKRSTLENQLADYKKKYDVIIPLQIQNLEEENDHNNLIIRNIERRVAEEEQQPSRRGKRPREEQEEPTPRPPKKTKSTVPPPPPTPEEYQEPHDFYADNENYSTPVDYSDYSAFSNIGNPPNEDLENQQVEDVEIPDEFYQSTQPTPIITPSQPPPTITPPTTTPTPTVTPTITPSIPPTQNKRKRQQPIYGAIKPSEPTSIKITPLGSSQQPTQKVPKKPTKTLTPSIETEPAPQTQTTPDEDFVETPFEAPDENAETPEFVSSEEEPEPTQTRRKTPARSYPQDSIFKVEQTIKKGIFSSLFYK